MADAQGSAKNSTASRRGLAPVVAGRRLFTRKIWVHQRLSYTGLAGRLLLMPFARWLEIATAATLTGNFHILPIFHLAVMLGKGGAPQY